MHRATAYSLFSPIIKNCLPNIRHANGTTKYARNIHTGYARPSDMVYGKNRG